MKRFLSSFMFACMALVIAVAAGIASSATGEVKVNVTVVDYDQADVALYDAEADQWMSGYNTITDGQVAMGRTDWGANKITYVGVDASSLEGFVMKATLKCEISGSTDNKRNCAFGVGYNNSEWSADMTYNTADKSITLLGGTVGSASKSSTAFNEVSFDVTDAFKDGKVKTLIIYETAAAGGFVRNISVEIETADSELDVVKGKALSKVESLPVGDGLFVYKAADIDAYKAAVNAATTVEEINAVAMPEMTKPQAGKQYKMPNVTAEGTFLGEAKLSAEAEPIVFEEAEGGYYIKVRDNYLNMAGGNTWSMNATETATTVWTITPNSGAYTIKGPNGLVGADNKDAGSATYGNKGVANNGLWLIEAFANDPDPIVVANGGFDTEADWATANVSPGDKNQNAATGWTINASADWAAISTFAYGSEALLNNAAVPAADAKGATEGGLMGVAASWGNKAAYEQAITLPAGSYELTYDAFEANPNFSNGIAKNLIGFIADNGTEYLSTKTAYTLNEWTSEKIIITLAEETTGKLSVGYASANLTSNVTPKLFVDNIAITAIDPVAAAKTVAIAALPVGNESIFSPSAEQVETVKAAIEAAKTVEEVNAAANAQWTIPALTGTYTVLNTTANSYLGEVVLSAEAVDVVFEAAEGGFYMKANGKYINMRGDNTWSMEASDEAKTAWKFNLTDGNYTIQGPNGLIGSDNADAGSAVYGNKTANKNGVWTIAEKKENVDPTPDPEPDTTYPKDMTDKMVNAVCAGTKGTSGANGWTITGNGNPPYLYGDFFENWNGTPANAKFDYYQVVTGLPTGKYTVSAEIQYDGAAGDNEVGAYASTSADEVHGGNKAQATGFNEYTTPEILVTDGTLRIGLKTLATQTAMWTAARNFKLTMTGEISLDDFKKMYETAKAQITEELLDTMMNFQIRMDLMALKETAEPTTIEGYLSAINAINDKVAEANKSVKFYNEFNKKYDEISKVELDEAGNAAALAYPGIEDAIAAWAVGSLDETVDYISLLDAAIIAGVKGQGAGADMTLAMPATWEGANGKYGDRPERYYDAKAGSPVAADVMTQTITGLQAGEYEVTFEAAVNFTDGRGIDGHAATKEDSVSVVFAQDVQIAVEVVSQTDCSDFPEYTFQATVGEDGVLKYGIYNIDKGANWFVAAAKKLVYLGVPAAPAEPVVDTDLTADMFKNWSSYDASATVVGNTGCAYELGTSTGLAYGDGNVDMLNYADLKDYKFLVITATAGTPRPLFNRDTKDGQAPDHLIDMNNADHVAKYMVSIDGENGEKIFYVKLSEILDKYGYVHLLCVKGANWANVTVTGMKLLVDGEIPENPTAVNGVAEAAANAGVKKVAKDGKIIIVKDGKEISAAGASMK